MVKAVGLEKALAHKGISQGSTRRYLNNSYIKVFILTVSR
jgi:hypothetical protein